MFPAPSARPPAPSAPCPATVLGPSDARPRRVRAAVLSAVVVGTPGTGALGCAGVGLHLLTDVTAVTDPSLVLLALASLALAGVLGWATAATTAGVREAWSGPSRPDAKAHATTARGPGTPGGPTRHGRTRAVSAGVTALVVAALTAPAASAAPGPSGDEEPAARPQVVAAAPVDGSADAHPLPGTWSALTTEGFRAPRAVPAGTAALVTSQPTRTVPAAQPGVAESGHVVVLAGDSLWSIAARHLGPAADDTEVAAAWPRWWEANRTVVGDDPDLLLPGQRLLVPGP